MKDNAASAQLNNENRKAETVDFKEIETLSEDDILSLYYGDVEERLSAVVCQVYWENGNSWTNRPHACCRRGWDCPSNAYFPYSWYGECTHTMPAWCYERICHAYESTNRMHAKCVR